MLNGRRALFLADTGAANSTLFRDAADRYGVKSVESDHEVMIGVGGQRRVRLASVQELRLGDYRVRTEAGSVRVAGEAKGFGPDVVGVIGRDLFAQVDVEFDLAHSAMRLFKPQQCKTTSLSYWSETPELADLVRSPDAGAAFQITARLNGRPVDAMIDSGASTTVVTTAAAITAGVAPGGPGTQRAGYSGGFGRDTVETWTGTFDQLDIGDETVKHVQIRIADLFRHSRQMETGSRVATDLEGMPLPSMLLGADFLSAHRVMIANSQRRLYFTYNGGPIFRPPDVEKTPAAGAAQ